ncbi:MAG: rod shape-determining protein, partial [Lachnospiraceae bacterium]|nr:rod shape-determining protein [Lachnospiraceae bacterium]
IKTQYNFVIVHKTSESIKINIGSAIYAEGTMTVYGRNTISGLPGELEVNADEINEAITEHLQVIMDNIKVILERTPPEVSADIYKNGVYVTGGSSRLAGLDEFITGATKLKVNFSEQPENTVITGLDAIIGNPKYTKLVSEFGDR